jgi:hypothetical protein
MSNEKVGMKIRTRSSKLPVVHFKNARTCRTLCGKNYNIPKRKVTRRLGNVTCCGCLHNIKNLKWIKNMITRRNRTSKSPQEIIDAILSEVAKSS